MSVLEVSGIILIKQLNSPPSPLLSREGRALRCKFGFDIGGEGEFGLIQKVKTEYEEFSNTFVTHGLGSGNSIKHWIPKSVGQYR